MPAESMLPLTSRGPAEVLFHRGAEPVTTARFLAEAAALAARLPPGGRC